MEYDIICLACLVCLVHFSVTVATGYIGTNHLQLRYRLTMGKTCHPNGNRICVRLGISIFDCVKECALRTDCLELSYERRMHVCELFSTLHNSGQQHGDCVHVSASDIEFLQRPELCKECVNGETCVIDRNGEASCAIKDCWNPPPLSNGTILGNMVDIGSTIRYRCDDDYIERDAISTAVCLSSGHWSENAICVEERNLAEGQRAYQSSTLSEECIANNSVDGHWGKPCSCTTKPEIAAWWEVDLGGEYFVKRVVVQTKPNIRSKFRHITVTISSTDSHAESTICATHEAEAPLNTKVNLECSQIIKGQYVRISKIYESNGDILTMCEVGVYMW